MKSFIVVILAMSSLSAFACRPNIYAIKNTLVIKAITAVSSSQDIEDLSSVKLLTPIQMAHVEKPANGINCPDHYSATVEVSLKDKCFGVDAVTSFKADTEIAVAVETKCEK